MFRSRALQMERRKNREANAVVVESGVLRSQLAREGIAGENIIVAHNAVDAAGFSQEEGARTRVRNELGLGEDTILVGYLGSYAFYHDTIRLVLAADIIRQRNWPANKDLDGRGREGIPGKPKTRRGFGAARKYADHDARRGKRPSPGDPVRVGHRCPSWLNGHHLPDKGPGIYGRLPSRSHTGLPL